MEGPRADTPCHDAPPPAPNAWRDLGLILSLLVLAVMVRGWQLVHTEVPARDTIGFIRYALEFEIDDWRTVLRNNHQHPGYPLTILAVSVPARSLLDWPESEVMSFSAQLASNLAAVLLVLPMYFLGKLLFHRGAGFGAAALFQCLPVTGHILSDGLSESPYLLLASSTLALAAVALRGGRPWQFALCGVFCGLSYLTRPEGLLLLLATGVVLLGLQLVKRQRHSPRQLLACGLSLTLAAVAVGSPYFIATQRLTNKPSAHQILGKELPELGSGQRGAPLDGSARVSGPPLMASMLAFTLNLNESPNKLVFKAVWGLTGELVKSFHYVAWLPTLLGMWWFRRRAWRVPGLWVVLVLCSLQAAILCRLAVAAGYVSDRHLTVLVMCGTYAAAAAVYELPSRLSAWLWRQPWHGVAGGPVPHTPLTTAAAAALLAGMLAAGMPKTLETLHANRAGHHAAGLWLAQHAAPVDVIEDDHCWAHYYAGRVFTERCPAPRPPDYLPVRYVVVGRRDREINLTWNHQPLIDENKLRVEGGRIVYYWPTQSTPEDAPVVVYAVTAPAAQGRPRFD
jgi:hypothetical protein